MTETTLYAWGRPLSQTKDDTGQKLESNLDHTWVTNFVEEVNPDKQPDPEPGYKPKHSYWYCWGEPHTVASHNIGRARGNIETADAISPSNTTPHDAFPYSSTSGSIKFYGLDGVCHTVANQVLCATGTSTEEPVRVKEAKGYPLSTFFYGTYGLNETDWELICEEHLPGIKMPGDDFIPLMEKYVTDTTTKKELLDIRAKTRADLAVIREITVAYRNSLPNAENPFGEGNTYIDAMIANNLLTLAAVWELLGEKLFNQLFPATDIHDMLWMQPPAHIKTSF